VKLYRTNWYQKGDNEAPKKFYAWAGTQRDAAAFIRRMRESLSKEDFAFAGPETTPVDVPTDKVGLIAWLNEHINCEL
jgi:hypothetical protein